MDVQSIFDYLGRARDRQVGPPLDQIVPPPQPETQQISQTFNQGLAKVPGIAYEMSGVPDAFKALRGEMDPEEAKTFAITAGMGLFGGRRPPKLPPLVGTIHTTASPLEFAKPAMPPATHDIGFHHAIDPWISNQYGYDKESFTRSLAQFLEAQKQIDPNFEQAYSRSKPYLADVRNTVKYPVDAVKWNVPEKVIEPLQTAMQSGFKTPRGLLSDLYNISGNKEMWQNQLIPMLKARGIDSLIYPHTSLVSSEFDPYPELKYNTLMTFDPEQTIPRFSPEGVKLAKERGVINPMRYDAPADNPDLVPKWSLPRGILHQPEAGVETLRRRSRENTVPWWQDPNDPLFKINADEQKKVDSYNELIKKSKQNTDLWSQYTAGKLTKEELAAGHDQLYGKDPGTTMVMNSPFGPGFQPVKGPNAQYSPDIVNAANQLHDNYTAGLLTKDEYKQFYKDIFSTPKQKASDALWDDAVAGKITMEQYEQEIKNLDKTGSIGFHNTMQSNLQDQLKNNLITGTEYNKKLGEMGQLLHQTNPLTGNQLPGILADPEFQSALKSSAPTNHPPMPQSDLGNPVYEAQLQKINDDYMNKKISFDDYMNGASDLYFKYFGTQK